MEFLTQLLRNNSNGFVRPLALGLKTAMRPDLRKGDFNVPTLYKPFNDLLSGSGLGGRKEGGVFGLVLFLITDQHPTDRHG